MSNAFYVYDQRSGSVVCQVIPFYHQMLTAIKKKFSTEKNSDIKGIVISEENLPISNEESVLTVRKPATKKGKERCNDSAVFGNTYTAFEMEPIY